MFAAFGLACVTAVPIGLLMSLHDGVRGVLDPLIEFNNYAGFLCALGGVCVAAGSSPNVSMSSPAADADDG